METRHGDEDGVTDVGDPGVVCDAVREVAEADAGRAAFDLLGDHSLGEDMEGKHGIHGVAQRRGQAELRPGDVLALPVSLGAVSPGIHAPSVDSQCDTAGHMGDDGRENEEWLQRERLIVRPREEQVLVGFPRGLGNQGYKTGVGVVHGQVDCGRDGRVFLETREDFEGRGGCETKEVGGVVC